MIDLVVCGIDIEGISYVINYELLLDLDFFVYCVGRIVCVGYFGIVVMIYDLVNEEVLDSLEK